MMPASVREAEDEAEAVQCGADRVRDRAVGERDGGDGDLPADGGVRSRTQPRRRRTYLFVSLKRPDVDLVDHNLDIVSGSPFIVKQRD